jgi:hypothetical protein
MAPIEKEVTQEEMVDGGTLALPLRSREKISYIGQQIDGAQWWWQSIWFQLMRNLIQITCICLMFILLTIYCNELIQFYTEQSVAGDVLSEERCNDYRRRYRYEMYGYDDCKKAERIYNRMSMMAALQNMILGFFHFLMQMIRDITFRMEVVIVLAAIVTPLLSLRRLF